MRKTLLTLAATVTIGLGACLGPNNAMNSIRSWNGTLTESKWVNELVFLGFTIIPVYSFAYLSDIVIFNSFEFWGAENPISAPADYQNQSELGSE